MGEHYLDKLRDPRWQRRRLEMLNKWEWTCEVCGDADFNNLSSVNRCSPDVPGGFS